MFHSSFFPLSFTVFSQHLFFCTFRAKKFVCRIRTESGSGAWCPQNQIGAETKEWLQIDFTGSTVVSAVETQGRYDEGRGMEYAPGYMLEYWRDSLGSWARYKDYTENEVTASNCC